VRLLPDRQNDAKTRVAAQHVVVSIGDTLLVSAKPADYALLWRQYLGSLYVQQPAQDNYTNEQLAPLKAPASWPIYPTANLTFDQVTLVIDADGPSNSLASPVRWPADTIKFGRNLDR
jgi:hypothetical protein